MHVPSNKHTTFYTQDYDMVSKKYDMEIYFKMDKRIFKVWHLYESKEHYSKISAAKH